MTDASASSERSEHGNGRARTSDASVVIRETDGRLEVLAAPDVGELIPVTLDVLAAMLEHGSHRDVTVTEAGDLDIAGALTVRPRRFQADPRGWVVLVCERIA
jgi:hypothetical protein